VCRNGPRVHYHTGLVDEAPVTSVSEPELRQMVVTAQERLLHFAATVWRARSTMGGDVLDVLISAEVQHKRLSDSERKKYEVSLREHTRLRQGLADSGLRYALLSFSQGKRSLHLQDSGRQVCFSRVGA
jgi:hypothetical protein